MGCAPTWPNKMTLKERLQAANLGITVFDDINQSQISYMEKGKFVRLAGWGGWVGDVGVLKKPPFFYYLTIPSETNWIDMSQYNQQIQYLIENSDNTKFQRIQEGDVENRKPYIITEEDFIHPSQNFRSISTAIKEKEFSACSERKVHELIKPFVESLSILHAGGFTHKRIAPTSLSVNPGDPILGPAAPWNMNIQFNLQRIKKMQRGVCWGNSPPEFLLACPQTWTSVSDMYQLGVLLFLLYTGKPIPKESYDLVENMNEKINNKHSNSLEDDIWSSMSSEGKKFISRLLNDYNDQIMTSSEALSHRWMKANITEEIYDYPYQYQEIRAKFLDTAMKGTAKTWRIYYVVGEALNLANLGNRKDIRKVYDMIDRDEDGILGMEDIKFFLEEWKKENKQKLTEQKLRALENEILYNLANTDYHKFKCRVLRDELTKEENISKAFEQLDKDDDEMITRYEMADSLKKYVEEIEESNLLDGDNWSGYVRYQEFKENVIKGGPKSYADCSIF